MIPWTEPQVHLKSAPDPDGDQRTTAFTIHRLLAPEAQRLWEIIRPGIGPCVAALAQIPNLANAPVTEPAAAEDEEPSQTSPATFAMAVGAVVGAFPPDVYAAVQKRLYRDIWFVNDNVKEPRRVAGNEDQAFDGLSFIHMYELTLRGFVVNFFESWVVLNSYFPDDQLTDIAQSLRST